MYIEFTVKFKNFGNNIQIYGSLSFFSQINEVKKFQQLLPSNLKHVCDCNLLYYV